MRFTPVAVPSYVPDSPVEDEESSIDLRALALKIWNGRWVILICTLIGATLGALTSSTIAPTYRATATVMFDLQEREIAGGGQLVGGIPNQDTLQTEIEVLKSTSLAGKVVDALNLTESPEFNPRLVVRQETLRDRIRNLFRMPDAVREFGRDIGLIAPPPPPAPPPSEAEVAELERRIVTSVVQSRLSLAPVEWSRVIEIGFVSGNPGSAARLANTFAEQYIVDQLDARLEATRAAAEWLSGRVEELEERVQIAEEAVEAARATQSAEAGQSLEITSQQLEALNATLSVTRNEARTARATYDRLAEALENGVDYGAIPEFQISDVLGRLRAREIELESQEANLIGTVPDGHPALVRVRSALDEVRSEADEEAGRIVEAARVAWLTRQQAEEAVQADVRELESLALDQSREQVTIRQLEREAEASRILYENFLGRLNETAEQEKLESADARILSRAEPPLGPMSEAKNRTLMISTLLGAAAGLGLIFLLDRLNNTFRSANELEEATGTTVLGAIPLVGRRLRRKTVLERFKLKPKSGLAESVRSLRTSILFSNVDRPPRTVMFTSSLPREGKSTVATLVATTSRQMGKSAIIVDCDLRLPAIADLLAVKDQEPGLLSLLDGSATLDEATFRDADTGLDVLITKPHEPRSSVNAADLLSSQRFTDLVEELKRTYDLVILDTPPTLVVTDARILSAYADALVYVVRWDSTPREAVAEGLKDLRAIKAPIAGLVLSMVNEKKAAKHSYDGYGYYRGRYRNYYVE